MDVFTPEKRSAVMGRIRGRDTRPEMIVRRTAHRLGYRFRLHAPDLPGRPDLVFPSRRKVLFVHGCYWHRHPGCRLATTPASNATFWKTKFEKNMARDVRVMGELRVRGWEPVVVWECETRDPERLSATLQSHLGPTGRGC